MNKYLSTFLVGAAIILTGGVVARAVIGAYFEAKAQPKIYQVRTQVVHDYIFENGIKACASHQGFHYVMAKTTIFDIGEHEDYPCEEITKFRCQDGTVIPFETGITHCFISESQLRETL